MKASKKIAFSSILVAISVIMMLIGSFFGSLDLSAAAIASFCIILAVIEMGYKSAILIYAAASVLALRLPLPSKSPAVFFAVFLGYYPIVKSLAERCSAVISYVVKFFSFSAAYVVLAVLVMLFIPEAEIRQYIFIGYFLVAVVFLIYDFALTRLISVYCSSLRNRLGIARFFGNNRR